VNRYRDAYRVGSALVGVATAIKVLGVVLALAIGLGSLSAADSPFGRAAVFLGLAIAVLAGGVTWVGGVIVGALGELLRATLDSAVAVSPFLTAVERLEAMGLPRSIGDGPAAS